MSSPFREAKTFAGGDFDVTPQARDLIGRLLIVKPVKFEAQRLTGFDDEKNPGQKKRQDTVWADVLVLDAGHLGLTGGILEYGGDGKAKPNTDRITTPAFFPSVLFGQSLIVAFLKSEMDDATYPGFSLGVIYLSDKGRQGNPPIVLGPVKTDQWDRPRPRAEEIWAFCGTEFARWASGEMKPATVSELIAPLPHHSPDAHKAYQERLTKRGGAPQASTPAYTPPAGPAQPQVATQYAPGAPPAAAAPDHNAVPPTGGWTAEMWANMPDDARRSVWASIRQVQPTH